MVFWRYCPMSSSLNYFLSPLCNCISRPYGSLYLCVWMCQSSRTRPAWPASLQGQKAANPLNPWPIMVFIFPFTNLFQLFIFVSFISFFNSSTTQTYPPPSSSMCEVVTTPPALTTVTSLPSETKPSTPTSIFFYAWGHDSTTCTDVTSVLLLRYCSMFFLLFKWIFFVVGIWGEDHDGLMVAEMLGES